jgi:GGDEF domain-containing protein
VSDDARPRRGPRAQPVAELPVEILLDGAQELARRWAIALIGLRPLERIDEIPFADLAREAPALCAQAVRALESEAELERMAGGRAFGGREDSPVARRLAPLAGARDAGAAVEAVEALRGVLWEALMDELREPSARRVADLADRLAYVCATVLDATLNGATLAASDREFSGQDSAVVVGGPEPAAPDSPGPPSARRPAILVDEREDVPPRAPPIGPPQRAAANPLPWDMPLMPWDVARTEASPMPRIGVAEGLSEQGPAAWIGSIGRQLERAGGDGLPFAVLLVELFDLRSPERAELAAEFSTLTSQVESALEQELQGAGDRTVGSLTRERPGRYWLLAPRANGVAARALAERLARGVRRLISEREAPLEVAVGTAVCPEDGREAAALAAHADIALFDARAAGRASTARPVALVDEPV